MPQFFTGFIGSLRVTYDAIEAGDLYSYNTLALQDDVEDGSQLAVVWKCQSVTRTSDSAVIFPAFDLSTVEAEQIYLLDASLYSVNPTSKEVTITSANVENSLVTVGGVEYRRGPLTGNVTADFPIIVERATDIAAPVVTYQPGSRLSHTTLNASSDQTIYALQEMQLDLLDLQAITGDVDLGNASIGELGDVTLTNLTATPEIFYWDGSGWINATFAEADIATASGYTPIGHTHVAANITNFNQAVNTVITGTSITTLMDVNTGGAMDDYLLRFNGIGWVAEEVTGASLFFDAAKTSTIESAITDLALDLISVDGAAVKYADSVDALSDVDTTTSAPTSGDFLKWNGANWVPETVAALQAKNYAYVTNNTPSTNPTGSNLVIGATSNWAASDRTIVAESTAFFSGNTSAAGIITLPAGTYRISAGFNLIDASVADVRLRLQENTSGGTPNTDYGANARAEVKGLNGDQSCSCDWIYVATGTATVRILIDVVSGSMNINGAFLAIAEL